VSGSPEQQREARIEQERPFSAEPPRDVRAELYRRYVSTFKGEPDLSGRGAEAWWDRKYLPLLAGLDRTAPVLELGCGSGALLAYLQRRGFSRAFGIDVSAEQVALAERRGVHVEQAEALDYFGRCDAALGAIIAVDVLEHLTRDELVRLAPRLFAALVPGGRLLVQTANGAGLLPGQVIYGDLTHQTIFTPESLGQLLRGAGFAHLSFYETGPIPIRLRGRVATLLWRAITLVANTVRSIESGKRQAIWTDNFICLAFKPRA
jgi:SAM-dependent methyltransferase